MRTTLNEILNQSPCGIRSGGASGFSKLLKNLNKTEADDEPLHVIDILKSNGIKDAVWALGCFDYLDCCLFLADVAELALPEFERARANDNRPRKAIQAIRDYKSGLISRQQLIAAADDGRDAGYAAYAACYSIGSWTKIEELLIKHFGDNQS